MDVPRGGGKAKTPPTISPPKNSPVQLHFRLAPRHTCANARKRAEKPVGQDASATSFFGGFAALRSCGAGHNHMAHRWLRLSRGDSLASFGARHLRRNRPFVAATGTRRPLQQANSTHRLRLSQEGKRPLTGRATTLVGTVP
jgi:hypothetical protein